MPPKKVRLSEGVDSNADVSIISQGQANTSVGGEGSKEKEKSPKEKAPKKSAGDKEKDKDKDKEAPKEKEKKKDDDAVALDDLLLPRSLISRLARGTLPPNTNLQRDAILAIAKSATVFISLLASEANALTDRKTIQPGDVLKAIKEIEFGGMKGFGEGERVERELRAFEEGVRGKRRGYRDKVKARESAGNTQGETTIAEQGIEGDNGEREEGGGKRARLSIPPGQEDGSHDTDRDTFMNDTTMDESRVTLDDGDKDEEDDQEDEESESDEGDADEEDEDETQNPEDTLEMDGDSSLRKHHVLAPDGRVEVEGSDDDD